MHKHICQNKDCNKEFKTPYHDSKYCCIECYRAGSAGEKRTIYTEEWSLELGLTTLILAIDRLDVVKDKRFKTIIRSKRPKYFNL